MGNKALVHENRLKSNLLESQKHLKRVKDAFSELQNKFELPIKKSKYDQILNDLQILAFCDQIIYRFSKLQDVMGAKLFKSFLLFQGENVDKPFLDILNELEKMDIIDVDNWFELRDLRNEIAHEYGDDMQNNLQIINEIFQSLDKIETILKKIEKVVEEKK